MRTSMIVLVLTLSALGCSRNPPSGGAGSTRTTGGTVAGPVTVDEIRTAMLQQRPDAPSTINALTITNDDGVVTLRGAVEDEKMKTDLVDKVKSTPGVKDVKDELKVEPKAKPTTTTTPQAGQPTGAHLGDAVRSQMNKEHPNDAAIISHLVITEEGNVAVLRGTVPDARTRDALVKSAKDAPGVKSVRDELRIGGEKAMPKKNK